MLFVCNFKFLLFKYCATWSIYDCFQNLWFILSYCLFNLLIDSIISSPIWIILVTFLFTLLYPRYTFKTEIAITSLGDISSSPENDFLAYNSIFGKFLLNCSFIIISVLYILFNSFNYFYLFLLFLLQKIYFLTCTYWNIHMLNIEWFLLPLIESIILFLIIVK